MSSTIHSTEQKIVFRILEDGRCLGLKNKKQMRDLNLKPKGMQVAVVAFTPLGLTLHLYTVTGKTAPVVSFGLAGSTLDLRRWSEGCSRMALLV